MVNFWVPVVYYFYIFVNNSYLFYTNKIEMSRCGVNRWGPGTTCERPQNTEASKELKGRLEELQKERAKQDQVWITPESKPADALQTKQLTYTSSLRSHPS